MLGKIVWSLSGLAERVGLSERAGLAGRGLVLGGVLAAGLLSGGTARAQDVDAIVKKLTATHTLTIGYRETSVPMSFLGEDKVPTGYSVDMCRRIAEATKQELKLPELKYAYVPVNIQTRQALVANGTVDIECGGTVNTFARNKQVDFTSISFVASNQLLVLKDSGVKSFADLNGKVVLVATAGSSEPELQKIMTEQKLTLRVLKVDDHPAALLALESHRGDAYFSDNSAFFALIQQSRHPENLAIVGPEIGYAPQGFMIPKNNPTFLWIANHTMAQMYQSGEGNKLIAKWFGPFGVGVGPRLRAAWDAASLPE
ncbi:MAG TPA: amino acid ABC transporter substrate-binding protein [Stellaceae bacterium]|nr:amino acid ABC transporter substrate-binding protein [Stellaceae bacterium]